MLNLGFLVDCIVNLLIGLVFFLFFLYFSLRTEKIFFVRKWITNKIGYFLTYFVLGLFIGLISSFFSLIQISINTSNEVNKYIFISDIAVIVLCGFYLTPIVYLGSTITYSLFSILFHLNNQNDLLLAIYLLIFYVLLCLAVTLLHFLNQKKFWVFFLFSIFASSLMLICAIVFVPNSIVELAYILPWIAVVSMIIYYLFSIPLINYIGKTKKLSHSIQFDKNNFILYGHTNEFLLDHVAMNKIKYGVVLLFDFSKIGYNSSLIDKLITKMVKSKVHLVFTESKPIWFLTPKNYYGIFLEIDKNKEQLLDLKTIYLGNNLNKRLPNDLFYEYEIIFKSLPKKIKYKDHLYPLEMKAVGMIYGIHSCDFSKGIHILEILMQQYNLVKNSNIVQVFNPKEFKLIETDANIYKKLINTIKVNELIPFLDEYENLYNMKKKFYYANLSWPTKFILNKNEILKKIDNLDICNALIRFMAIKGINLFLNNIYPNNKKAYLIIDYPIDLLCDKNFNAKNFLTKLKQRNFPFNNLIINIFEVNNKNKTDFNSNKNMEENIKYFQSLGIKFSISSELMHKQNLNNFYLNFLIINGKISTNENFFQTINNLIQKNVEIIAPLISI